MDLHIRSKLEAIAWPALLDPHGSQMLALLYQLEKTQWWQYERLLAHQFQQLNQVWSKALFSTPYYSERLKSAGFNLGKQITADLWPEVPVLNRRDLQQHEKDLLNRSLPKTHGATYVIQTSGSTGLPVRVTCTAVTSLYWQVLTVRDHLWHQRDFSGKLAVIRHGAKGKAEYPGLSAATWGASSGALVKTGPAAILNSASDITLQAKWLTREKPTYLLTYPSNLNALAQLFLEKKLPLENLRGVETLGEALGDDVRTFCHKAWGVPLVDMYSTQEVGYIALQCPEDEVHYHVQAENILVEVVDEKNRPCGPGEIGRVLVTTLHNFAMPLIRYEVGDYAEVGPPCPCGRGLPVLKRILGRVRNMLTLPSGEKRWPDFGFRHYEAIAPIRQFQMVQKSLEDIEMRLVVDVPLNEGQEAKLAKVIQVALGHPFRITFSYHPTIQRSASGKFEDFLSEVQATDNA